MSLDRAKVIERSVDSLQRIYSVLLALALGQAIAVVVLDNSTKQFVPLTIERVTGLEGMNFFANVLPIGLAFVATIIPFHQGMNRHLDFHYLCSDDKSAKKGLLLDFVVFLCEGALFFALASSIRLQTQAYFFFFLLLVVDILWALVARLVHRSTEAAQSLGNWPVVNFFTLVLGIVLLSFTFVGEASKAWLFFLLALSRTIFDYWFGWNFYFPFDDEEKSQTG